MEEKEAREQYSKLKQIDKFAKELGFTIFRIDCEFEVNGEVQTLKDTTLNKPTQKYLEFAEWFKQP